MPRIFIARLTLLLFMLPVLAGVSTVLGISVWPGAPVAHAQDDVFNGSPAGTEALATRLRARHQRDLPTPEQLADAESGARLRWLADHHPLAMVRTRALRLLAVHHDVATRELVLRVLDSEEPVIVRAAALEATEGWPMDSDLARRMRRLADEQDPRLAEPARKRLGRQRPR